MRNFDFLPRCRDSYRGSCSHRVTMAAVCLEPVAVLWWGLHSASRSRVGRMLGAARAYTRYSRCSTPRGLSLIQENSHMHQVLTETREKAFNCETGRVLRASRASTTTTSECVEECIWVNLTHEPYAQLTNCKRRPHAAARVVDVHTSVAKKKSQLYLN